jgi:hypothetical protein
MWVRMNDHRYLPIKYLPKACQILTEVVLIKENTPFMG